MGANLDSIIYDVTSFALDSALLPSMTVSFDGGAVEASTAPLVLPMISVVPPQADGVRDIAALADFGVPIWPYVLLGLATIAAAALLVYFLRRPKQPLVLEAAPTAARLSPHEEALPAPAPTGRCFSDQTHGREALLRGAIRDGPGLLGGSTRYTSFGADNA